MIKNFLIAFQNSYMRFNRKNPSFRFMNPDLYKRVKEASEKEIFDLNDRMEEKITKGLIYHMTHDEYRGRWALVSVDRRNNEITVSWKHRTESLASDCDLMAYARNIEFVPSFENAGHKFIGRFKGDGQFSVELEEGSSYFFELRFTNLPLLKADCREHTTNRKDLTGEGVNHVYFIASVPLSQKNRNLLNKAGRLENNAGEQIIHLAESLMEKEKAFHEGRSRIIESIKSMGLQPEEEKEMIDRMVDMINLEREKFGL